MADLSLDKVGDEQLLELLNECVVEVLSRDPLMHRVAHAGMLSVQKKRDMFMTEVQMAMRQLESDYVRQLRDIVRAEISQAVIDGEITVSGIAPPDTEAKIVVDETLNAIEILKRDLEGSPGDPVTFKLDFTTKGLKYSYVTKDGRAWDGNRANVPFDFAMRVRNAIMHLTGMKVYDDPPF